MKYRQDPDLDFLKQCTSRELDLLVKVLLFNKEGLPRSIVQLPNHPLYKEHAPNHAAYWEVVAGEIQRYGSNPLAALARAGRGKHFIKILDNVCSRLAVRYLPDASVEVMERTLCLALFTRALQPIPSEDLQIICDAFDFAPADMSNEGIRQVLVETIRLDDHAECLLRMIVANGAAMHASGVGYAKVAAKKYHAVLALFENPLAVELEGVSSLSMTGAAHWIIIPAVLQLAFLRSMKYLNSSR